MFNAEDQVRLTYLKKLLRDVDAVREERGEPSINRRPDSVYAANLPLLQDDIRHFLGEYRQQK